MSRRSSATAASTAAISSASGGSGMYSLAPAWIAATAARASVAVPQATIGAWMCSASSAVTRSRMAMATSTISRSAPRPDRSTASAWAISAACVTVAPLSIASLVAVVSWPLSVPTIRSRIVSFLLRYPPPASRPFRLDDFRHRYAELFFDQNDLAASDQAVVDVDVDRFADLAVEFEHCAGAELEEIVDFHPRPTEHCRDLNRNVEYRFEIAGDARRRPVGLRCRRHIGFQTAVFQIGQ